MSSRTYLVRTVQRPVIVCPSWCAVTEAQHVDELASLDGGVMHIGDSVPMLADGSFDVHPIAAGLVDGTPDPEDPELRVRFIVQRDEAYTLAKQTPLRASSPATYTDCATGHERPPTARLTIVAIRACGFLGAVTVSSVSDARHGRREAMRLPYAGVCRDCGIDLPARSEAIYDRSTKSVRCVTHGDPDTNAADLRPRRRRRNAGRLRSRPVRPSRDAREDADPPGGTPGSADSSTH